ncbi:MAG: patatin family protein [Oscillospiraceae bacterium]|jgi:predicted patatin/cPLA2 family phospholipase|nr:patatin family protein [Oscillospiraceae bacterium]
MIDAGLILEGGGMRGIYTAGALDCFLDEDLLFTHVYGVSAGACHACSYLSRQRGRAAGTVLDFLSDPRYGSLRNWITTGDYFGADFVYAEVPQRLLPFDFETFRNSAQTLFATVTHVESGRAEYRALTDLARDMDWLRASASLPLLSRLVTIEGRPYLDGGVADAIPLARSIADGHRRNLLILTRHRGYRKTPANLWPMRRRYRRYPRFLDALRTRHQRYNDALALADAEAAAGRTLIIQPQDEMHIGRLEKDAAKLRALYELGYADAAACVRAHPDFFAPSAAKSVR